MVGVVAQFELDTAMVEAGLRDLAAWQIDALAFNIGALLETATKERIADDKAGPDGEPWAAWSEGYAATRSARHSLLVGDGLPGLLDSIQNYSDGPEARVGTNLVYGAIHQFGGEEVGKPGLPARPYLGLSDRDRRDIAELVTGDLNEVLQ
ncbi:phage virion morphogenesis protein [Loktanella sp. 3ANDIMAR09]|uniref:phage virion morphogenesis protein n=1 Tax=Loktanella sp. 3ANDIMAR09 TaxID=1225657 RepID=UPI0006FED310|nr:phage virion morphogenesis protein [Loktanella sp. 3ANDIMAR09]